MSRLARAWNALTGEQRLAALAAGALLVTMFLPWYELQSLDRKSGVIHAHSISAFGDVSFVEAAIFLVAAGVLMLLFARAERRDFHMPGSDGTVVMIAGGWAALLIFYRVFSRPDGHGYPVGIQWGFFLAFVAAGGLAYVGWRMRATAIPEPPLLRRRPREPAGETEHRGSADAGEPGPSEPRKRTATAGDQDLTAVVPAATRHQRAAPVPAPPAARRQAAPTSKRPRYPPAPAEQLSFEDQQEPPD
jgi:hypothetical protein